MSIVNLQRCNVTQTPDSQPPARTRGRPKAAPETARRAMITRSALDLFLERGYGGTSMADVAAAAHMSLGTIYRFFAGKTELFAAVVSLHRHSMLVLPGDYDGLPVEEALMRIFQVDIDPAAALQRHDLMSMLIVQSRQFPELLPIMIEHGPQASMALLAGWLQNQHDTGHIHTDDSHITARMLMDIVFGAPSMKNGHDPQWPGGENRSAYLRQCFAILAHGLRPRTNADNAAPDAS